MFSLRNKVAARVLELNLAEGVRKKEEDNIYIRQIDYTQDLNGFFMSLSVIEDLNALGELLGVGHSNDYNQLNTLF